VCKGSFWRGGEVERLKGGWKMVEGKRGECKREYEGEL
jgi:hypothetical protein